MINQHNIKKSLTNASLPSTISTSPLETVDKTKAPKTSLGKGGMSFTN